eukprot:scaffold5517_cov239-Pinguiococcus_pyrenoidosus.AAC.1
MSHTARDDDEPLAPPKLCRMASYHPYKDLELSQRRGLLKRQSPFPYLDSDDEGASCAPGRASRAKKARIDAPQAEKTQADVVRRGQKAFTGPIRDLSDVISLAESYSEDEESPYPFNHRGLWEALPVLRELRDLVGLETVKRDFVDQVGLDVSQRWQVFPAGKKADPRLCADPLLRAEFPRAAPGASASGAAGGAASE